MNCNRCLTTTVCCPSAAAAVVVVVDTHEYFVLVLWLLLWKNINVADVVARVRSLWCGASRCSILLLVYHKGKCDTP